MWYKLDVYKLSKLLLPQALRETKMMAFLEALLRPLDDLHYLWTQKRKDNIFILNHNWQVCYMRAALNEELDQDLRRIYIDGTGGGADKTYLYTPAENQPKYLGKLYIRQNLEFADTGADFIVYVPAEIMATRYYEVHAQIELYKLGGKRYLIIEI